MDGRGQQRHNAVGHERREAGLGCLNTVSQSPNPERGLAARSEELGKWMEVGNSGMFRPEMLRPMGLPEGVNVIAWGLSLER